MSRSLISRSLEPLAASLWGLFLGWTALLAWVWLGAVDANWVRDHISNDGLRSAVTALVDSVVPAWLGLAVANIHLALARAEGLHTARLWLWVALGGSFAVALLARKVDLPFGRIHFLPSLDAQGRWTWFGALGPFLFGVPVGWALLWLVWVAGARELFLWFFPKASHGATTRAGALLVILAFVNLDPLAHGWRWRWWFWDEEKPDPITGGIRWAEVGAQWLVIVALAIGLSWLMRQTRLVPQTQSRSRKPALVFLIFNALLLFTHLRFWLLPPATPDTIDWPSTPAPTPIIRPR